MHDAGRAGTSKGSTGTRPGGARSETKVTLYVCGVATKTRGRWRRTDAPPQVPLTKGMEKGGTRHAATLTRLADSSTSGIQRRGGNVGQAAAHEAQRCRHALPQEHAVAPAMPRRRATAQGRRSGRGTDWQSGLLETSAHRVEAQAPHRRPAAVHGARGGQNEAGTSSRSTGTTAEKRQGGKAIRRPPRPPDSPHRVPPSLISYWDGGGASMTQPTVRSLEQSDRDQLRSRLPNQLCPLLVSGDRTGCSVSLIGPRIPTQEGKCRLMSRPMAGIVIGSRREKEQVTSDGNNHDE